MRYWDILRQISRRVEKGTRKKQKAKRRKRKRKEKNKEKQAVLRGADVDGFPAPALGRRVGPNGETWESNVHAARRTRARAPRWEYEKRMGKKRRTRRERGLRPSRKNKEGQKVFRLRRLRDLQRRRARGVRWKAVQVLLKFRNSVEIQLQVRTTSANIPSWWQARRSATWCGRVSSSSARRPGERRSRIPILCLPECVGDESRGSRVCDIENVFLGKSHVFPCAST